MIEFVKRPDGSLIPRVAQEALVRQDEANRKRLGFHKIDFDRLKREAAILRKTLGPEKLAQMYPCRTCRLVTDDLYKLFCDEQRLVPCFVRKHMRGCKSWQPRLIVGKPTAAAS